MSPYKQIQEAPSNHNSGEHAYGDTNEQGPAETLHWCIANDAT